MRWRHRSGWQRRGAFAASALAAAAPGSRVRIVSLPRGRGAVAKLLTLGLTPGRVVLVAENRPEYPWSPVIVDVDGIEVAIGRGLAAKISVEVLEENGAGRG